MGAVTYRMEIAKTNVFHFVELSISNVKFITCFVCLLIKSFKVINIVYYLCLRVIFLFVCDLYEWEWCLKLVYKFRLLA